MAIKAIRNSDGNVLKNSSGKTLKANYVFGKSMLAVNRLAEVPRLAGVQLENYTLEVWGSRGATASSRGMMHLGLGTEQINMGVYYHSSNGLGYTVSYDSTSGFTSYSNTEQAHLLYRSDGTCAINGLARATGAKPNKIVSLFRIGWGKANHVISSSTFLNAPLNRVTLYGRIITDAELKYNYNKLMGNDKLSLAGVILDIHCNKAEILDFSAAQDGSDMRVGMRDTSGNNYHAFISPLPAGTLQEQLAYANTNLFTYFRV